MNEQQLLAALIRERFGPVPTVERYARPAPLVVPRPCPPDTPRAIAARRRELCVALDGEMGKGDTHA